MLELERRNLLIKVEVKLQELDWIIENLEKSAAETLRRLRIQYGEKIWSEFLDECGGYDALKNRLVFGEKEKLVRKKFTLSITKKQIENSFLYF